MKFNITTRLTVTAMIGLVGNSATAAFVPLVLTGWNQDIIAENTTFSPASGTSTSIVPPGGVSTSYGVPSNVGWVFYESGAPNSTQGLPTSGEFTSTANSAVTFQFQPYVGNNAILNSGTLTLTTPSSYASLAFLTSSQGAGGQSFNATLNFSDGSTTVLSGNDPDWVTPPPANTAIANVGLVLRESWSSSYFYSAALDLFEHDYTLSAGDQSKLLKSISFTITSGNYEMLFGVDGEPAPAPSAPVFTVEPVSQVVSPGQTVTFSAQAVGYPSPAFQWQFDGTNISGATSTNYTIPSAAMTNTGFYTVVASNSVNTNLSSAASLGFISLNMLAAVYVTGPIGANYQVEATPAAGPTNWTVLTNITIPSQPYIYVDYSTPTNSKQFYRAVPQ